MIVRPATVNDVPAVIGLFRCFMAEIAALDEAPDVGPYVEEAIRQELSRLDEYYLDRSGHGFWVMVDGDRVTGSVGLERAGPNTAELRRMIVDIAARRCGRGTALLAKTEREAVTLGYDRVVLRTSSMQPAARALYERAGYLPDPGEYGPPAAHKGVDGTVRSYRYSKVLRSGWARGRDEVVPSAEEGRRCETMRV